MSECNHHNNYQCDAESLRLEGVITAVGFDDLLDVTLEKNFHHFDNLIVVTAHDDYKTQRVGRKHGVTVVQSDLFYKNGRKFNKGAAVNAGFDYFQYMGWRLHMDADIVLPDHFRRILFNHTHLERDCLYGCDRVDVVGKEAIDKMRHGVGYRQHQSGVVINDSSGPIGHRWVDHLRGYCPLGFFQLWHASKQRPYPYSLGTAAHDDLIFSTSWPLARRRHLPTVICRHICADKPYIAQHWNGQKRKTRID